MQGTILQDNGNTDAIHSNYFPINITNIIQKLLLVLSVLFPAKFVRVSYFLEAGNLA